MFKQFVRPLFFGLHFSINFFFPLARSRMLDFGAGTDFLCWVPIHQLDGAEDNSSESQVWSHLLIPPHDDRVDDFK
jgi:hypothetical protein